MDLSYANKKLGEIKLKLESLNPCNQGRVDEAQEKPLEVNAAKLSAAQNRLKRLYKKTMDGRSSATQVDSTGAKR